MIVLLSRFTPGLPNAIGVGLRRGDKVLYTLLNGNQIHCVITSDRMRHTESGHEGWEGTREDQEGTFFLDEKRVIDWEGKV